MVGWTRVRRMGTSPVTSTTSLWATVPVTTISIFTSLNSNTNILQIDSNYHINYKGTYPFLIHVVHSHLQPLQQPRLILWIWTEQSHNSCEERPNILPYFVKTYSIFGALWPRKKEMNYKKSGYFYVIRYEPSLKPSFRWKYAIPSFLVRGR